jgi:hypothetical protein
MITNDTELELTRERLKMVEAALDSLRRDVKSKNEKLYQVMSVSYIDLLLSIRGDIDAYLGICPPSEIIEVEGVIRRIDLDAQTFILRERANNLPDLPCEYSRQMEEAVKALLGRRVTVSGTLEPSRLTGREKLEAETIEAASPEEEVAAPAQAS